MADPGWYPDPGGRSGHYRFWDGQSWGLTTTTELPGGSTPTPGGGRGGRPRRSGTRWVLVGTALAVVLVLVAVGALVLRQREQDAATPSPSPVATSPGGGDGSTAAPTPETASPAAPSATPTPTAEPVDCPVGDPFSRQPYPEDGRGHGGSLSFPVPDGWSYPGEQTSAFTWAYDVGEADLRVQPQWFTSYAAGAVSTADGFEDPRSAAELILRCTLQSSLYRNVLGNPSTVERETTLDGYPAFTLSADVRVQDDRTTFEGDRLVITVVDLDSPESLAFFWGCAPLGDPDRLAQLEDTARSVTVG